ncbi:MAG: uridine monophosphate kinase [Clostridia bacterium]|nr:uridine monophosphate kinase [Clostridia bacterium]
MYKRIVLKLSGETLAHGKGEAGAGSVYSPERVEETARMLIKVAGTGAQLIVILGGGNIWRGRFSSEMDAVTADQMGMLATIMNALCAQDAVVRLGGKAKVFTAQEMTRFAELYTRDRADEALNAGNIVFIAGGSGNPFFTTDTAAALRAAELGADIVFKGTSADGIYDKDPNKYPDAVMYSDITYQEAIDKSLQVMDTAAFVICRDRKVPAIRVFKMDELDNIYLAAAGAELGTLAHL